MIPLPPLRRRLIVSLCMLCFASAEGNAAPTRVQKWKERTILSSELKIGDAGYGLTVLQGDSIIRFPVTYIGTLENAMAKQDIILIRLHGQPYEKSGVIAGMSGSPIYFDGRLLGALAYGWGFAKEPIAGVTPINMMLELMDQHDRVDPPKGLRPLGAPLSVAGLSPEKSGETWKRIDKLGFLATPGGRSRGGSRATLLPGSAVGVRLIDGDISITAIGTVTCVSDSDIVAFGHPFLNRGFSKLPMTAARIETIMPSQEISFKMGTATDDVGAILRDASPGISGRLGPSVSLIPVSIDVAAPWGRKAYRYEVARDDVLSPFLYDIAWSSSAEGGLSGMGPSGVEVTVAMTIAGREVKLSDRGVVDRSVMEVMPTVPVKLLYENPYRRIHPDSIAIHVEITNDLRRHEMLRVRALKPVIKAGESLPIEILWRTYEVGRHTQRIDLPIPKRIPEGPLAILLFGGRGLGHDDLPEPQDLDSLLDRLAAYESQDMLIVRALPQVGRQVEIDGGMLPDLPRILQKVQTGSDRGPVAFEMHRKMDAPVIGGARIDVWVEKD